MLLFSIYMYIWSAQCESWTHFCSELKYTANSIDTRGTCNVLQAKCFESCEATPISWWISDQICFKISYVSLLCRDWVPNNWKKCACIFNFVLVHVKEIIIKDGAKKSSSSHIYYIWQSSVTAQMHVRQLEQRVIDDYGDDNCRWRLGREICPVLALNKSVFCFGSEFIIFNVVRKNRLINVLHCSKQFTATFSLSSSVLVLNQARCQIDTCMLDNFTNA